MLWRRIAPAAVLAFASLQGTALAGGGHGHGHGGAQYSFSFGYGYGPWWGGPWGYGPGYYASYPYLHPYPYAVYPVTVYAPVPQGVVQEPPVYVERAPASAGWWYYCESAGAYYPDVATCEEPWVRVPPRSE